LALALADWTVGVLALVAVVGDESMKWEEIRPKGCATSTVVGGAKDAVITSLLERAQAVQFSHMYEQVINRPAWQTGRARTMCEC
jgi:hypothetical protein